MFISHTLCAICAGVELNQTPYLAGTNLQDFQHHVTSFKVESSVKLLILEVNHSGGGPSIQLSYGERTEVELDFCLHSDQINNEYKPHENCKF